LAGLGYTNDFWRFNAQTRNWAQLSTGSSGRGYHCLEWDQGRDQLILFGGYTGSVVFDDLWTYSIGLNQWRPETPVGTSKAGPRYYHACAFNTQSSTFHVQGGAGVDLYQDLWQFNFTSNRWTLNSVGDSNVQRYGHSLQYSKSLNSFLVVYGRNDFSNSYPNTIYQFSLNNQSASWTLFQVRGSQIPSTRKCFSTGFNYLNGEYYVFGGGNGNEFSKTLLQKYDPKI
jgi:hypothetical protein